jgi:polyhydroxyalkanoate synthesis regulator protein
MPRTIVKYGNRKLYDPSESKYVSMMDVAAMIVKEQEVRVISDVNSADITLETLSRILYEIIRNKCLHTKKGFYIYSAAEDSLYCSVLTKLICQAHAVSLKKGSNNG